MIDDVGGIAATLLLVGFPEEELMEHDFCARHLFIDMTLEEFALLQLGTDTLRFLERTDVGELRDSYVDLIGLFVCAFLVDSDA